MALHHAKPGEIVHLQPLGPALRDTATSAIIKSERFEAMRLVVRSGTEVPSHHVSGTITLHCLEGAVELILKDTSVPMKAGDWTCLGGDEPHALKGVEDSSVLVTIIFDH